VARFGEIDFTEKIKYDLLVVLESPKQNSVDGVRGLD